MQRLDYKPAELTNGSFLVVTSVTNARSFDEERLVPSLSSTNERWTSDAKPHKQCELYNFNCLHSNKIFIHTSTLDQAVCVYAL